MPVPFTFGTATTSIPLSNLDANFNTPVTIGNTTVGLGNTVTTLGNLTLTNTTISSVSAPLSQTNGGTGTTTGYYGFKNRIINGAMVIDQRNAGASVTAVQGVTTYPVDRTSMAKDTVAGVLTGQRSTTAPAGFTNSLLVTVSTSYTASSGEGNTLRHIIEGFNVADLSWGTASAQAVTLSFWVRSSVTGTFSGALGNSAFNRSYPFTFAINSANTFEYKTITIAGDTSGTWVTDNGVGIRLYFNLGSGSSLLGTAGAWTGSGLLGATGSVALTTTNGATFYITGVQLEVGSTATSFDYRPYGTELALCQRYYVLTNPSNSAKLGGAWGSMYTGSAAHLTGPLPVPMRAAPTFTLGGANTYYISNVNASSSGSGQNAASSPLIIDFEVISLSGGAIGYPVQFNGQLSITAEL